ncbi:hypothetical protein BN8_p06907 (plasmid) [Fibrisoma limi BUZ 3]|uniref:Uncharacterized protein n=1 Tax=Fibrisoma limi BUZ 3 TaxID=1185876 RepID=I2GU97_9BACT|nr:hypothetical protein BN8_p06907 [Fibrisoma limi BUZ 3]
MKRKAVITQPKFPNILYKIIFGNCGQNRRAAGGVCARSGPAPGHVWPSVESNFRRLFGFTSVVWLATQQGVTERCTQLRQLIIRYS